MTARDSSRLTRGELTRLQQAIVRKALEYDGFAVNEPDDRGITDLIATRGAASVSRSRSARCEASLTSLEKHRLDPRADRRVALVLLLPEREPLVFVLPAQAWRTPDRLLVSRELRSRGELARMGRQRLPAQPGAA
jgi:hypothetical protein